MGSLHLRVHRIVEAKGKGNECRDSTYWQKIIVDTIMFCVRIDMFAILQKMEGEDDLTLVTLTQVGEGLRNKGFSWLKED